MSTINTSVLPAYETSTTVWKGWQKIALRFFALYIFLQAAPLDWKFYRDLFAFDIFRLAHYTPRFFGAYPGYADWALIALLSAIGVFVWTAAEKRRGRETNNEAIYYWLRVVARYRLAIAVFAYGFIKLFPVLSPYPSLSNLNTEYGQYSDWKVFSLSLGIVPSYESFLGGVEVFAAILLLFRKTAGIGAFILVFFIGNVFFSNLAYEGGEHVYSFYLITLALVVLSYDIPKLYVLIGLEKPVLPHVYKPVFQKPLLKWGRVALKAGVALVFLIYAGQARAAWRAKDYKYPSTPGLKGAAGLYNVSSFVLNKDTLQYSLTGTIRWQDVVFEEWNTISIRTNTPVAIDRANVENGRTAERNYESEGAQSRRYFSYTIDSAQQILLLHDKNPNYKGAALQLHYDRPSAGRIVLQGVDEHRDSVTVVLDRRDKKYLLEEAAREGRRKSIKL
ncbi:MAG: DoxX family protein [Bacteroidetes bacterium]|nr:DoxX family protein [Bacteroidota bacterium]